MRETSIKLPCVQYILPRSTDVEMNKDTMPRKLGPYSVEIRGLFKDLSLGY